MMSLQLRETVVVSVLMFLYIGLTACKKEEIPFVDHPQIAPGARMEDVSFKSAAMGRVMMYRVFIPASTTPGTKLPVVYLLHGCGGDVRDWSNYSLISVYSANGYILVMPAEECSYYVNSQAKPGDKYEDFTTRDLIEDVESRFPAKTGRENRAVVGVSMGGYGAITYALVHPELYSFVGAISPAVDVPGRTFSWKHYWQSKRFESIFGKNGSTTRDARDPFKLVESTEPNSTPYIYMTAGEQEAMYASIKRFAGKLKARNYQYQFHTKPGGHDWNEWNKEIPGCMKELTARVK
jgi:S-formylglutathione hydrolase FrmB